MISIVSTLYCSEPYIEEFVRRCRETLQKVEPDHNHEIVLVDDGSPDDSLVIARNLALHAEDLLVVELSRNFGHHAAMLEGLRQASGDRVYLVDSDLEESPEWLIEFYRLMSESDSDVVYGVQSLRRERGIRSLGPRLHYWLRRKLVDSGYPADVTTARLMTRSYVDALLLHRETGTPILDLWVTTGFRQQGTPVAKASHSPTTYSSSARVKMLFGSLVFGSGRILVLSSVLGLVTVVAASFATIILVVRWAAFDRPSPGWTSVMLAVLFMGGAILSTVSLIGLTLARVAVEVRGRPRAIIRNIHRGRRASSGTLRDA